MKIKDDVCFYCGKESIAWYRTHKVCNRCWRRLKMGGEEYLQKRLELDKILRKQKGGEKNGIIQKK